MKNCILALLLGYAGVAGAQIQELFDRAARYQHFNGVVLVEDTTQRRYEICKGDARPQIPIGTQTAFDIGSLTKQFTAAAVLQLVQAGRLDLHRPINTYLGELGSKHWRKVTVHHLLTHTSGIPSLYQTEQGLDTFLPETTPIGRAELPARFRDAKTRFRPGEEFAYSNSGYILLAVIVERVSGLAFGEYLVQRLFAPHGLTDTHWGPRPGDALPYYGYRADLLRAAPRYHPSWMVGAGGVYASADDLMRWLGIIRSSDFLNAELRDRYLQAHARGYGYGWQHDGEGRVVHDGITAGFAAYAGHDPATGTNIVLLTNRGFEDIHRYGRAAERLRRWADQLWADDRGESVERLPASRDTTLTGTWTYTVPHSDAPLRLTARDSVLELHLPGRYPARVPANVPLPGDDDAERKLTDIADFLRRGKYRKIGRYCDGEMKFVVYSGLFAYGFKQIKKRVGRLTDVVPYHVTDQSGLIRLNGDAGAQDVIVYFDAQGRIQGLFEHGFYPPAVETVMRAYPTENGGFYLDGFPHGEASWSFWMEEDGLVMEYLGRAVRIL